MKNSRCRPDYYDINHEAIYEGEFTYFIHILIYYDYIYHIFIHIKYKQIIISFPYKSFTKK